MIANTEEYMEEGVRAGTVKPSRDPQARAKYLALSGQDILYVRGEDPSDRLHNYLLASASVPLPAFNVDMAQSVFFSYERGGQPPFSPSLGNATPGYTFVYSPSLHGQGGYMFNLNTDGIPSNTSHFMDIFVPNDTGAGDYLVTFNVPASP